MNWKQKTIVRILLVVARIVNDDEWLAEELKTLSNHICHSDWAAAQRG